MCVPDHPSQFNELRGIIDIHRWYHYMPIRQLCIPAKKHNLRRNSGRRGLAGGGVRGRHIPTNIMWKSWNNIRKSNIICQRIRYIHTVWWYTRHTYEMGGYGRVLLTIRRKNTATQRLRIREISHPKNSLISYKRKRKILSTWKKNLFFFKKRRWRTSKCVMLVLF